MKPLTQCLLSLSLAALSFSIPTLANATSAQAPTSHATSNKPQKARFFFVLRSARCDITKTTGGYEITFHGLDNRVMYFTDRPVRTGGFIPLSAFMKNWSEGNDSFQNTPPNAVIIHPAIKTDAKGVAKTVGIVLSDPIKIDSDTYKFKLKALTNNLQVGSYHTVSVLIDLSMNNIALYGTEGDQVQTLNDLKTQSIHQSST